MKTTLSKSNLLNRFFSNPMYPNRSLAYPHFVSVLLFDSENQKKRITYSIGEFLEKFGKEYAHVALCHSASSMNEVKDKLKKDGGLLILDYDTWFEEVRSKVFFGKIDFHHQRTLDELIVLRRHAEITIIVYSSNLHLHEYLQFHSLILKPERFHSGRHNIHKGDHVMNYN